ncbi:hypothetical protein ACCS93_33425 [Rhizobium ruizarguesonis]
MEIRAISDVELARYLRQVAVVHKDRRTGNPLLATALQRLADRLENEGMTAHAETEETQATLSFEELKELDEEAVSRFIEDPEKNKAALVALAASRFSIPPSKLLRMKLSEVREALKAALQHENSLRIIGLEAERQGSYRKS